MTLPMNRCGCVECYLVTFALMLRMKCSVEERDEGETRLVSWRALT